MPSLITSPLEGDQDVVSPVIVTSISESASNFQMKCYVGTDCDEKSQVLAGSRVEHKGPVLVGADGEYTVEIFDVSSGSVSLDKQERVKVTASSATPTRAIATSRVGSSSMGGSCFHSFSGNYDPVDRPAVDAVYLMAFKLVSAGGTLRQTFSTAGYYQVNEFSAGVWIAHLMLDAGCNYSIRVLELNARAGIKIVKTIPYNT